MKVLLLFSKHKTFVYNLYNVEKTSSTLVQNCRNVTQMFCVYCILNDTAALLEAWTNSMMVQPSDYAELELHACFPGSEMQK